jgi:hypothetical protein
MIDLWDPSTLPAATRSLLDDNERLIVDYLARQAALLEVRETAALRDEIPLNELHERKAALDAEVARSIMSETIRGFHHTRLTDDEVRAIRSHGIPVTSLPMLRQKLDAVVAAGLLMQGAADHVYDNSPLVTGEHGERIGTFYATAHPLSVDDGNITPFHESWGGEISTWAIKDEGILDSLRSIGKPRVIEVAIPIAATGWVASRIAQAIVAAKGCEPEQPKDLAIDISIRSALPADYVLRVHTEGEPDFAALGRGYPSTYVKPLDEDEK